MAPQCQGPLHGPPPRERVLRSTLKCCGPKPPQKNDLLSQTGLDLPDQHHPLRYRRPCTKSAAVPCPPFSSLPGPTCTVWNIRSLQPWTQNSGDNRSQPPPSLPSLAAAVSHPTTNGDATKTSSRMESVADMVIGNHHQNVAREYAIKLALMRLLDGCSSHGKYGLTISTRPLCALRQTITLIIV